MRARFHLPLVGVAAMLAAAPAALADYHRTDLISDQAGHAMLRDPDLVNAWGMAAGQTPLWVADEGTGKTTVYTNGGSTGMPTKVLTVDIPGGAPAGQVFSAGAGFDGSPNFILSTLTGNISRWAMIDGTTSVNVAKRRNAAYTGLAIAGSRLYAADFHHGRVDVYNASFKRVHASFRDRKIPHGYAPFGIKAIGRRIYVTYAKQDKTRSDEVRGRGLGFVDAFNRKGHLRKRLVKHGRLNAPWGLVKAPSGFGRFSGDLLVGNFGNGAINAYDRRGRFQGALRADHKRLRIDGLWDLQFGNGIFGGPTDLIFSAGPDDERHGLVGTISPR